MTGGSAATRFVEISPQVPPAEASARYMVLPVELCPSCQRPVAEAGASFCPHCGQPLPSASPSPIGPGTELDLEWGKVILGELIGEGGMGAVHQGWLFFAPASPAPAEARPPTPVAIKLLHRSLLRKERARTLFLREATALSRLDHPNVVRFYALVQRGAQLAIVMELVQGQSLAQVLARHAKAARLERRPCLSLPRTWHYLSQLLGALGAIHQLGILHRDIKPGNLLVDPVGVCKLTDFGIARLPLADAKATTGLAPGTGAYMSPEQVMAHPLDQRADLYGAGVVLYEMLTGVTPFDRPDRAELAVRAAQLNEAPARPSTLVDGLPPALDAVVVRALAKAREQRFATAVELGEAVRAALELPDSAGWAAQRSLVLQARSISRLVLPVVSVEAASATPLAESRSFPPSVAPTTDGAPPAEEAAPASKTLEQFQEQAVLSSAARLRTEILDAYHDPTSRD